MSKEKWTDERKQNFIKSYINQPSLWNVNDANYAVKSKKELSYKALMKEFNLSLIEVKNKIRIYRTTYGQELKKIESSGTSSKLLWFNDLQKAFDKGKIKSFTKSSSRNTRKENESKLIEIEEYEDDENEEKECESSFVITNINKNDREQSGVVIEPYYQYEEEEEVEEIVEAEKIERPSPPTRVNSKAESSLNTSSKSISDFGMQSNELFLKSLQSTLDRLPDDKNMRARIKIQEVLYQIAYEVDK